MSVHKAVALVLIFAVLAVFLVLSALPASAAPDKFALIVGVAQFYGKTPSLPGSDGDAHDTRQFLLNNGWSSENVRTLVNYQASATAIRDGLKWLGDKCIAGTTCVFKYSGHVKLARAADGDNETTDEHLWTPENTFISDGEVARHLRRLLGRAWIDISGCEAAGFDDNVSAPNRVFTASSQEDEKSYESPAYRNSVWTELLVNQGLAQGKNLAEAFHSARVRAAKETELQKNGSQNAYLAGGDPASWFNRAPAPRSTSNCLLGFICL